MTPAAASSRARSTRRACRACSRSIIPHLVVGGSTTSAGTLTNISNVFGGTGYEVRTTEYRINRGGERSTFNWQLGDHQIEVGALVRTQRLIHGRRWYPFSAANNDLTPYDVPRGPNFTQYYVSLQTDDIQLHLQDQWHVTPDLLLQAGVTRPACRRAGNNVITQQQNLPTTRLRPSDLPDRLDHLEQLVPAAGGRDVGRDRQRAALRQHPEEYAPVRSLCRGQQFLWRVALEPGQPGGIRYLQGDGASGTSWTYEAGVRTNRDVDLGPLTSVQGQVNYYHVDFSNRLFNVAAYNFINPNPSVLVNVGGVTTDGVDLAAHPEFRRPLPFL